MSRALAVAAVLAAHLAVTLWLPPELAAGYRDDARLAWKLLAGTACAVAALALRPGDYMRWFWVPLSAAYLLLALAEPAIASAASGDALGWTALRALCLVAANALSVLASVVLARAYGAAGLGLGASWRAAGAYAVAIALSAAIVGPAFLRDGADALAGAGTESWASAFGDLADAATFVLLVPVLRFALRIAGGRLAWPWWAFALSSLSWLAFDATELAGGRAAFASEAFRTAACLLTALAAIYQRDLVASADEGTTATALQPTISR